jgi:hypothetical protein
MAAKAERVWKFFALTQVCKQIRSEYRPLWIRQASFQLKACDLRPCFDTFLINSNDRKHSPKMLQISWDHGYDNDVRRDVTPLLQLRAYIPSLKCKFILHKVAVGLDPEDNICDYCFEMMNLEDRDFVSRDQYV